MSSRESLLNRRRIAAIGTSLAAFAVIMGLRVALARNDDGSRTFFVQNEAAPNVADDGEPAPTIRPAPPVRLTRVPAGVVRPVKVARSLVKPVSGPVTLLTDATLLRGDAAMTAGGIRIFKGAPVFPHRDKDFVALSSFGSLPRSVSRTLLAMDSVPRN